MAANILVILILNWLVFKTLFWDCESHLWYPYYYNTKTFSLVDVHILASSFLFWPDFSDQLQRINVGQVKTRVKVEHSIRAEDSRLSCPSHKFAYLRLRCPTHVKCFFILILLSAPQHSSCPRPCPFSDFFSTFSWLTCLVLCCVCQCEI